LPNAAICGNITGNMKKPSVLLDTNILVAGLSSRNGASYQLLRYCFDGKFEIVASVPLWLEYEAILKRAEIRKMHRLSARDIDGFLNNLAVAVKPTALHYLWRPQLSDPGDEMVLEAALNGAADALVTFNIGDFKPAADRLGLKLLRPADFLNMLKRNKP
jgi:putative PIN family toxin of toxin-antitoxin system